MDTPKNNMHCVRKNTFQNMEAQMIRALASTTLMVLMVFPLHTLAQDAPAAESDTDKRIAEMEERFQKEIDELKAQVAKNKEETENVQFELETLDQGGAGEDLDTTVPLAVYGFFDLSYMHLISAKDTPSALIMPIEPTFIMSSINLYFLSQMTDTLSAILELRFAYLPHGQQAGFETAIYLGDTEVAHEGEYATISTRVIDPFTTQYFMQGGVTIERVHLTYSPFDWLQVIAGRFLTPYGIWNIDHGSPVVLPVRIPYMQIREMIPLNQTGLQIFGRLFPTDRWSFDYAVTLSNGRGPMEQVYDLDKNKGVGLRLHFAYAGDKVALAFGGYGYYGTSTDTKKIVTLQMDTDLTMDEENYSRPLRVETETVDVFDEYIASADFLIEFFGVRIQSEYIWRYVDYQKSGIIGPADIAQKGGSPLETYYWSSYIGNGVYVLLAYELPLEKWITPVRITPYFMFEYGDPSDSMSQMSFKTFLFGLNIKPSPYVVLKAEYSYAIPKTEMAYGENTQSFSAQMAVSF
jgi:hypothetical protein